ncbi:MAG: energy transducer TonB [Rickettsiales bacterium]|jgi:TonB family protein|nr:energy transducer TonB [Rickettsiales bacterium]
MKGILVSLLINALFLSAVLGYDAQKSDKKKLLNHTKISLVSPKVFKQKKVIKQEAKVIEQTITKNATTQISEAESVIQFDDYYIPAHYSLGSENNPLPKYPSIALKKQYEGDVTLCVDITESGATKNVSVCKTSGYKVLDLAAINTVKKWHFSAAIESGQAVNSYLEIPISFKIAKV